MSGWKATSSFLNDIFQFEFTGETPDGTKLVGAYKIGRGRPSFWERLMYFQMDRAWVAAMGGNQLVTGNIPFLLGGGLLCLLGLTVTGFGCWRNRSASACGRSGGKSPSAAI